jgi:hypothetical protein
MILRFAADLGDPLPTSTGSADVSISCLPVIFKYSGSSSTRPLSLFVLLWTGNAWACEPNPFARETLSGAIASEAGVTTGVHKKSFLLE